MNQIRTTASLVVLAVWIAFQATGARAGDVTVVGSVWRSPNCPTASADFQDPPPMPNDFVPPKGELYAPGDTQDTANENQTAMGPAEAPSSVTTLPPVLAYTNWPLQSSWYTRIDYFALREHYDGSLMVDEDGTIYNLGYVRSSGAKRARIEVFSGKVKYFNTAEIYPYYPTRSTTMYTGVRGEFELLWDMNLHGWPSVTCFGGLGMRFWVRDIQDGYIGDTGNLWAGHQENWWVLYPYLGMEKRWHLSTDDEFFASGRIGSTACTWMYASYENAATLWPQPNLTAQLECGLRHEFFYISAFFDAMAWNASSIERNRFQPSTESYTTGLKLGLTY